MPTKKIIMTIAIVHQEDKVLLGLKKRGFGMNRWNGFGGKVEKDETIEESAVRETFEEASIELLDLRKLGEIDFSFEHKDEILEVHIFKSTKYGGTPEETEEMKPAWFDVSEIPFKKMWSDDPYWFPLFLENKTFKGKFHFDKKDKIISHEIIET
ncbi:8-oxo-dGTP diphosphatase [Candidatus Parcubacteria bacterium]|jgi:8-oxo-dGTP pyrophosphatase MutT (NUDIX family)|nr:8-oxo-dGTP diphosphatase [Candidatus Parcubacteria bacterium]MBT7228251.1 8-oxo-dGTP diphosphatase [Candidatus Parcubacteria bacterium]